MKRAKHNRSYWRSLYDNQKNRSYSTVPAPADRDNTLWSARIVFINDNIKTFGEEGELRLNIIFSIPDPFIVLAHRTEFITDSHFKPIEEAKTGGLMKKYYAQFLYLHYLWRKQSLLTLLACRNRRLRHKCRTATAL